MSDPHKGLSLLNICLKCGSLCCKYGSPVVWPKKRERIVKYSSKDYFQKKNGYFIIPKNPCPYLTKNDFCSIEKVKPLDCKVYPVSPILKSNKIIHGISQKCPAKFLLDKEYTIEAGYQLNQLTGGQKKLIANYNKYYSFDIQEKNKPFGQELVLDLYGCNTKLFNKTKITEFFVEICKKIKMKRYGQPMFWHDEGDIPHLKGISAVQFITTSNITIHCLEMLGVYINIFSCKPFNSRVAEKFAKDFWQAEKVESKLLTRK